MKRKHKIINITVASFWRLKMMALNLNWRNLCYSFHILPYFTHIYIFYIYQVASTFFSINGILCTTNLIYIYQNEYVFFLLINEIGVISIETAVKLIGYYIIIAGFMLISITKQSNKLNEYKCLILFIN